MKKTAQQIQADIDLVQSLVEQGFSRAAIMEQTGLKERFVRTHSQGVVKGSSIAKPEKTARDNKLNTAARRVYVLAVRPQGIKDFELRDIVHSEYGASYDSNTLYRVKQRANALLEGTDNRLVFVPDWVCDESPAASREALEAMAINLQARIDEMLDEYMEEFATGLTDDQTESTEAQRKQHYAARRHLLKLAISDYGQEPTAALLARSVSVTDALQGTQDVTLTAGITQAAKAPVEAPQEATGDLDAFFDFVEDQQEGTVQESTDGEDDIFASVGVADAQTVGELTDKAQQIRIHVAYLQSLEDDDKDLDHTQEKLYHLLPKFDISKYTGGSNAKQQSGLSWQP